MPHARSMKKLLIGTIFARDDDNQRKWFELQMNYLRATTEDFDHITYLYGPKTEWFESQPTKVIKAAFNNFRDSTAHIEGLNSLLAHFKFYQEDYENFLFLDSDAFPIRLGWQDLLNRRMEKQHKIAVAYRPENLETRWHSSILYSKRDGLKDLKFDYFHLMDLIGYDEKDVSVVKHQKELRESVFPLLRSNHYNIHPTLCGVYYDMFYHHCCGSGRTYNMKSRFYWDHFCNRDIDVGKLTDKLFEDPDKFMEQFAWHPEHYGKVRK